MGANGSKDVSSRSSSLQSIHLKNKPQDLVDFGTVFPNGLYSTTPQDFDSRKLRQLILTRKISPFYTGLPDAPEQVAASHHLPKLQPSLSLSPSPSPNVSPHGRPRSASNRSDKMSRQGEREPSHSEKMKIQKAMLYNDAVECPICFLYYPPNINYSRCCDQPICTECFIQIHRPTDDPSSPATCPFCLESNYGVTYVAPAWAEKPKRLRSFSSSSSLSASYSLPPLPSSVPSSGARHTTSGVSDGVKSRRKSISHTDPTVVLIDHIRPNWNKPSTPSTTSRSSRRNSLSSSGNTTSSAGRNLLRVVTRPGRSASSAASTEYNQYLATVRDMNMDLEEWMVMEAIRLSLSEQQEEQARNNNNNNNNESASTTSSSTTTRSSPLPPLPQEQTSEQVVSATTTTATSLITTTTTENIRDGGRDDDDEQPLALHAQQYQQQDTLYSSPSISSSSSSSEVSLENQECALEKKLASEHETTTATAPTTTTAATTTTTPDMVC